MRALESRRSISGCRAVAWGQADTDSEHQLSSWHEKDVLMRMQPLLLTTSLWAVLVSTIRAEEPPLPANLTPPVTAYARATREGDALLITLKLARPTKQPANGILKPTNKWQDVKLKLGDPGVQVLDTSNKPVAAPRVAQLLQKDTPVLV